MFIKADRMFESHTSEAKSTTGVEVHICNTSSWLFSSIKDRMLSAAFAMLEFLSTSRVGWTIGLVLLTLLLRFFRRLHFQRSLMRSLPGPPHSYLFGSLLSMAKVLSTQPSNAAPQTFIGLLKEHYELPDVFYFDPCKTHQSCR